MVSLWAAHHLHGVYRGWVRVHDAHPRPGAGLTDSRRGTRRHRGQRLPIEANGSNRLAAVRHVPTRIEREAAARIPCSACTGGSRYDSQYRRMAPSMP